MKEGDIAYGKVLEKIYYVESTKPMNNFTEVRLIDYNGEKVWEFRYNLTLVEFND